MVDYKTFPSKPGVYYFKNKTGQIIYIGKALSLRHRVANYFQKNIKDPKTKQLVSEIDKCEYLLADSEFDALLLEAKLIKEHRPKYNVLLKDDKRYLYIAISKENCPRIFVVRKVELEQNLLDWYGPFPSGGEARQVLKTIRHIFPYRTRCKVMSGKPCLDYQLNLCPGVCFKPVPEYKKIIFDIRQILSGKTNRLLKSLATNMQTAAKNLNFEEAQKLKRQLTALTNITQNWRHVPTDKIENSLAVANLRKILVKYQGIDPITVKKIEGYDISNLGKDIIVGGMVAFSDGVPDKAQYRKFKISLRINNKEKRINLQKQNDPEGIKQIIFRRLNHPEWLYPQLILVDGGKGQVTAAQDALKMKKLSGQIALLGLAKRQETIVLPKIEDNQITKWKMLKLPKNSPALKLLQSIRDESHRFAQNYYKLLHRKKIIQ